MSIWLSHGAIHLCLSINLPSIYLSRRDRERLRERNVILISASIIPGMQWYAFTYTLYTTINHFTLMVICFAFLLIAIESNPTNRENICKGQEI